MKEDWTEKRGSKTRRRCAIRDVYTYIYTHTRILERLDFSKNEISRNRCDVNGKRLQMRYLRFSSTTPSSTEPGKNQLRTKNIPIYFIRYTPLPPPFDRDFRPSRGAAAAALFSLQRFASPTSGPPSLSQVLLRRVSVARFHESFHAFPSHLGDGDGPPFRFPRSPFIDRLDFESTPLVGVRAPTALDHFPPRGRK